jgi:gliding motility-associated-like protein
VNAVNDALSQGNESASTTEDSTTPIITNVTANNIDPDGTTAVVTTIVSTSGGGTATNNGNGTISYVPASNFNGVDTIIYTVCDQGLPLPGICVNDTLFVTVNAVNDAPIVDNEYHVTGYGVSVTGDLTNGGDSDIDGNLVVSTNPIINPSNGSITINSDGTYTYIPNIGFEGIDTIVVQICDDGSPLPAICVNDTIFVTVSNCLINPLLDCDNDGLTNDEEITNGSDPQDPCDPNNCDDTVDVPNAFTPDGDGINDALVITGIEQYPENTLVIFNRWGNIVFEVENYKNDWTGTTNVATILGGEDLPTGTYYYLFDLKKEGTEPLKGFIYIQR